MPGSSPVSSHAPASPARVLLEGDTLHIGFHRVGKAAYPEDIVPPAVLRALAQHLHLDLQTTGVFWGDYCFFAGVTGEAFRFLDMMALRTDEAGPPLVERYGQMTVADMYRHALEAAGLAFELFLTPNLPEPAALRQRVVESLAERHTPVIGFGVFGAPEPFLITGYDEAGAVLLGWSHLQAEAQNNPRLSFEPAGQFRLRDWETVLDGMLVVTGRQERPPLRDVYRAAIQRAVPELRATAWRGGPLGTASMARWASYLEDDAAFAGLSPDALKQAQSDHSGTAGDHAERRALASSFLEIACRVLPEAAQDLAAAGTAFQGAHDTVYEIWEIIARSGPFDPDVQKFADSACRRTMAALVRRLADLDRRGASSLERALRTLDGEAPGPPVPPDAVLDGTVTLQKAPAPSPAPPHRWAPENIHLPNSMGMLRTFLGEPFGDLGDAERALDSKLDYVLWMGITGAAFGLLYDGPERLNLPLAFDALGYDYELWLSGPLAKETDLPGRVWGWDDNLRRRIFWNLRDRRLPVLLFSCGPWPDWYLVTQAQGWFALSGYGGSSGDQSETYRPNEPLDDPENPLRPIKLFEGMQGRDTWTVNVTARRATPKPPLDALYTRAIQWGAQRLRAPRMKLLAADGTSFVSEQPYQDWAAMLRTDALFPAGDEATLRQRRQWLEGHEVELAERRFYGARFLDVAAARLGQPALAEAARHFRAVHQRVEQIWAYGGGLEAPDGFRAYADATTRHAIADLILDISAEDAAAAALL